MKKFMDDDFLLSTVLAKTLYHDYASKMPIIDYHCHIKPQEIAENVRFKNITQIWLGGDHYKWRLLRADGVDEEYITGKADDKEKFFKWACVLQKAIGNPIYHWSHLELKRYFNYDGVLSADTANEVWNLCNEKLASADMSAKEIIKKSNVKAICTTDEPIDSLQYHKSIKGDKNFAVKVLPAWRPDRALAIERDSFNDYISELSKVSSVKIDSFVDFKEALKKRIDFFNAAGCKASDHALEFVSYCPASGKTIEGIFNNKIKNNLISKEDELKYKTALMLFLAKEYCKLGWVMELHISCGRNNNSKKFKKLGADTGFDCIGDTFDGAQTAAFLNALDFSDELPKTILYSLNPNDDDIINSILGCFQSGGIYSKVQQGSAWWFNDHKTGMIKQMTTFANMGLLSNFVGMLTDSRSFLSYTRHEYFRRILCELIASWVENGEYPNDIKILSKIVEDISFNNANRYFGFETA
ncbi:MAG: glucuronate isomerase [Elusimicrobiota bacterium]|jgi:glucuronate isomerase|nr:glucuronate isomerase [Elusimicrobiota bacterium]